MKQKQLWMAALMAALLLPTVWACSDGEQDEWVCIYPERQLRPMFTLDADSIPHLTYMKTLTQSELQRSIVGHGWHCNAVQQIENDGHLSNENLLETMLGTAPVSYFFGEDELTLYFYSDVNGHQNSGLQASQVPYTYDEQQGTILVDGQQKLQLFGHFMNYDGREYFYAVFRYAEKASGVPVYCVGTYQRMSEWQLLQMQNKY